MRAVLFLLATVVPTAAHAEFLGLPNGRAADLGRLPDLSVEAGHVTGDFGDVDYDHPGLRLNYRLSDAVMLFGDLGKSSIGRLDDTAFGLGAFVDVGALVPWADTVVKGSIHRVDFGKTRGASSGGGCTTLGPAFFTDPFTGALTPNPGVVSCTGGTAIIDGDLTTFSMEVVFSGQPGSIAANPLLTWYANAGVHSFDGGRGSETEIGIGAGLVYPVAVGELYGGIDHIDEFLLGVGFRYFVE